MNKLHIILALAILPMFNASIKADNYIDGILSSVLTNNIDIKATELQLSRDSIDISSTNYLEDPSVDFEYLFGAKDVGDKWAIGISQGFDWPSVYRVRRQANNSKLRALAYTASIKRLEILYQAKVLCLDIINLNKQIAIQESLHNHYTDMYNNYSQAFNKGEITILDINKLRIELINITQYLEQLKIKRNEVIENLSTLNGGNKIESIENEKEYPIEEFMSLDTYVMQYGEYDPECNYYSEMNNAFDAEYSVARMGWLPKFNIGYKYSNEIGDSFNGFTVGASIPLFANRKKTNAAKAQEIANYFEMNNIENANISRIKTTFAKAVSLKEQLETYRNAVDIEANQKLLYKALDTHQISLLDYIQEMIYFVNAENKMLEIEYEYYSTMTELNKYSLLLIK